MEKMPFEEAQHLFLMDRKLRNLSPHTIEHYYRELKKFRETLEKQKLSADPHTITYQVLKVHIVHYLFEEECLSPVTINRVLGTLRAFFNFLVFEDIVDEKKNPMKKISMLKMPLNIVNTFTNEQLMDLLAQPDRNTFVGVRDYTIMLLFMETGVRVRELCDITLDDIDWEVMSIRIAGKNRRQRLVYFQENMKKQLLMYIRHRGVQVTRTLFVVRGKYTPIAARDVQEQINTYGRLAGITGVRCSPHTFRHTFARLSVQNKASIFALQSTLGHSTLNQVLTYVNLFSDEVKEEHKKFSPVENFFKE